MKRATDTRPAPGALRRAVLLGLFAGTGVACGYLLSGLPNFELMSLVAALAGGVLGIGGGAASGALAAAAFSLGNPLGAPVPVVLAAQVAGLALAGAMGGAAAPALLRLRRRGRRWAAAGAGLATGLAITLAYDLLTNLAGAVAFDLPWAVALAGAVPFSLVHLAGNVPQFLLLFPWLLERFAGRAGAPLRGLGPQAVLAVTLLLAASTAGAQPPAGPAPAVGDTARAGTAADAAVGATAAPDAGGAATPAAPDTLRAGAAPAVADSAAAVTAAASAAPTAALSAAPAVWRPFTANLVERLVRDGAFVAWSDGGLGARLQLRHEAGTAPVPLVLRDGVPLGVGHRWADDPWTVAQAGLEPAAVGHGRDGWGGSEGVVDLVPDDREAEAARVDTRFYKGSHGTYLRSVAASTPRAPWRLRLDFEETLDQQGYGLAPPDDPRYAFVPKAGEARLRGGWTTLEHESPGGDRLALAFGLGRKHKSSLPAAGLVREEIWSDQAVVTWAGRRPAGAVRASLFVAGADVEQDRGESGGGEGARKVEVSRQGARVDLAGGAEATRRVSATVLSWRLSDDGEGTAAWAGAWSGPARLSGLTAGLSAAAPWRAGMLAGQGVLGGWAARRGGWWPEAELACGPAAGPPWWRLTLGLGGRAPRSDELATVDRAVLQVGETERVAVFVPNRDLQAERTWRAALALRRTVLGTRLAVDGTARALREGIGWEPVAGGVDVGRWDNSLDLDAWCVTAAAEREGRLLGRARARAAVSWRGADVRHGVPVGLPPERSASLTVDWEYRAFHDDGILELSYELEHRGAADEPWLPAGWARLRPATLHHAVLGFRLLGADLSLAVRNLADARTRLSAGALGDGRELRWRLHWTFRR